MELSQIDYSLFHWVGAGQDVKVKTVNQFIAFDLIKVIILFNLLCDGRFFMEVFASEFLELARYKAINFFTDS